MNDDAIEHYEKLEAMLVELEVVFGGPMSESDFCRTSLRCGEYTYQSPKWIIQELRRFVSQQLDQLYAARMREQRKRG